MNMLQTAIALAQAGLHIFPVKARAKAPALIAGFPTLATRDPIQLTEWWTMWPEANVGVSASCFGDDLALIVVDVDSKPDRNGFAALRELAAAGFVFPGTYTVGTPSGGCHLYFWSRTGVGQSVDKLAVGIDIRSSGGYVVGPGSVLGEDIYETTYSVMDTSPIAEAPAWLVERLTAGRAKPLAVKHPSEIDQKAAQKRAIALVKAAVPGVQGSRDHSAFKLANEVKDLGVADERVCFTILLKYWRCEPPLSDAELTHVVRSAYRYGRNDVGATAPESSFEQPPADDDEELPCIQANARQLRDEVADAWLAVQRANYRAPVLYQQSSTLVRLRTTDKLAFIEHVEQDWMVGHLSVTANWHRETDKGRVSCRPPEVIARNMIARGNQELPELETVGTEPIFTAAGRMITEPGYDPEAAYYLHGEGARTFADLDRKPGPAALAAARQLLLDDLLVDFPFATEADRAHAIAAMLLLPVRRMIAGVTPLHVIEAPTPGSGKGKLADSISIIATGRRTPARTLATTEEEIQKSITAALLSGPTIMYLDNARDGQRLDSAKLASVLTAEVHRDRLLGASSDVTSPNKALWLMTGNNPKLSKELVRRCVRIRINRNEARPWDTAYQFKHQLPEWAAERRADLQRAALTMVLAWINAGQPAFTGRPLGSFEPWSRVMGGILEVAGIPGFLENRNELYNQSDQETREWEDFVKAWLAAYPHSPVTAQQLTNLCGDDLLGDVLGAGNPRSKCIRLGRALQSSREKIIGAWQIVEAPRPIGGEHTTFYRLRPVGVEEDLYD